MTPGPEAAGSPDAGEAAGQGSLECLLVVATQTERAELTVGVMKVADTRLITL